MRARRRWTEEEDQILIREATIQRESSRQADPACCRTLTAIIQHKAEQGWLTLHHLSVETGALKQWSLIADNLPGRNNKDCRKRWAKLGNEVKRGAWSSDEDGKLQSAVAQLGFKWTQVAEIVGTRHAEQCAKRWQHSLDPSVDHSNWDSNEDQLLMESVTRHGRNWKTIRSEELPNRSTTDIKNRHTMLVRKPPSHTASTRTRETSPRFSNAEQFMDDDFTLNETFWDEVSTNDQILPDALNALFPQDLDTTTAETSTHSSAADTPLQRSRRDSSIALTATTNTSASPANSTTYRPPTADMYDSNLNPLATGMWPSDWWVASPQQAQATPTRIDVSSSSNNIPTTQNDDSLWTDILPTIPPPDPLRPASSLAHDPTEYSTTNAPLDLMTLDADMPPTRQNRTDPKPLVGEPSSLDEDVNSDIEERLARKRKRLARGASLGTSKSRTTLVLEDVEPETLKAVMDTLLQSKTRISIAHGSDDGIAK